MYVIL